MFLVPLYVFLGSAKRRHGVELWNHFRKEGGWALTFLRPLNDWEMEKM